jgi:hypothetical protein
MTSETRIEPDFLEMLLLATGKKSERPAADAVVQALLQAEKAAKQQRSVYSVEALLGQWRLCFATGTRKRRQGIRLGKGFYLPSLVQAQIGLEPASESSSSQIQISNQLQVGKLRFRLTGPARYLNKKNLLAFDFTCMELSLFAYSLYQGQFRAGKAGSTAFAEKPIAQLPFFSFFLVTDRLIAARGRGGGLAIWTKVSDA